jgi:type 1 glutamine amidotransferase
MLAPLTVLFSYFGMRWIARFGCLILAGCVATGAAEPRKTPTIVLISGEYEYQSTNTFPAFKQLLESNYSVKCVYLERKGEEIPGLDALKDADLSILFIRRMTLPDEQLAKIKDYVNSGKPLIGLRTASHSFENWKEFDNVVLGGNYHNHYSDTLAATARINPEAASHPILKNVPKEFETAGSLYKTSPLAKDTTLLLTGSITNQPPEPMAWTHNYKGARVFYTSLGHPKDFDNPAFRTLLVNAIFWTLEQPVPLPRHTLARDKGN